MAHFGEKNSFCKYLFPFSGLIKNNCLNKSKFSWGFDPFKHGKKKKLSKYISARFWESHFISNKKSSLWISPKMLQKKKKPSLTVCDLFCGDKKIF